MDDKILSFNEDLPINKDSIVKLLHSIPLEITNEYIEITTNYCEELFHLTRIISAIDHPNLCHHLIDGLNEDQLLKLSRIAHFLAIKDPLDKVNELIELTFNLTVPPDENRSLASDLVKKVCSLDNIDYRIEAKKLARTSKQLSLLADTFAVLNLEGDFTEVMVNRLSQISTLDLENMRKVVSNLERG